MSAPEEYRLNAMYGENNGRLSLEGWSGEGWALLRFSVADEQDLLRYLLRRKAVPPWLIDGILGLSLALENGEPRTCTPE